MIEETPEYLYKYISFEQFIDLVEMERLYLTNITLWEDCYEGHPIEDFHKYSLKKYNEEHDTNYEMGTKEKQMIDLDIKTSYAQSWTKLENESDALWRIYSANKTGVRIKVKTKYIINCYGELINSSNKLYCQGIYGDVEYDKIIDYEEFRCDSGSLMGYKSGEMPLLFLKRKAFEHEAEYRFTFKYNWFNGTGKVCNLNEAMKKEYPSVIYYSIPNNEIQEVLLDPRAPKYFEGTFLRYCENRGFKDKNIIFKKSELYKLK